MTDFSRSMEAMNIYNRLKELQKRVDSGAATQQEQTEYAAMCKRFGLKA